ncbi:MAG TPA: hypothetical protein VHD87_02925, partial [Acidimicrobiales bacterium]|nr:hypothetical protein [Acidimicrobiales bacterium]
MPGPLSWSPPERPKKSWWTLAGLPIIALGLVLLVVSTIELPYVELAPGGASPINPLLKVPAQYEHKPNASFLLMTVSLQSVVRPFDLVRDYFDPDIEVISRKEIYGTSSKQQYNQHATQDMDDSKENAVVLAL